MKVSCIFVCLKIVSSQLKRNENEKIAKKYVHIQNKNISYKYGKGRRKNRMIMDGRLNGPCASPKSFIFGCAALSSHYIILSCRSSVKNDFHFEIYLM